jgi:50S ribosomal protein uL30
MKLAVVRVRGRRSIEPKIKRTLELLRLFRTNHCVIIENSVQTLGMLNVVKDYVAFGPVKEEAIARVLAKKGMKGAKRISALHKEEEIAEFAKKIFGGAKVAEFSEPVFRLRPPSKGYKDIKRHYPRGDLGKRPDMTGLLLRMS